MKGIMIAGSILVDKINEITAMPKSGELTQILKVSKAGGGCVPNVAIDIRLIDENIPVYGSGKIGNDGDGEFIKSELEKYGVNTDNVVVTDSESTSFTDVMSIKGGERTFFTYAGASADYGKEDIDLDADKFDMLHLGYFLLLKKVDDGDGLEILRMAKEKGIKTSIDLVSENSDRYSSIIPCLKYVDNLIVNEIEAGKLAGILPDKENLPAICQKLMEQGVKERVIIHMPKLSVCMSKNGFTTLPSYDLPDGFIKGSTGAGDAFCAGSLIGIYDGMEDKEILEFASSCAVMSLGSPDATSGVKSRKETMDFCSKFKRKSL